MTDAPKIISLSELVALPGMPSEPTIRKMIEKNADFPIISRGKNGVAFEFDMKLAVEFILGLRRREEDEARARSEELRQFGLELLGPDGAAVQSAPGLTPAERKALMEEELLAIKLAVARGDLVKKASVEEAIAAALVAFAEKGKSFSARLARRHDLPREALTTIDGMVQADLADLAERLSRLGETTDAAGENSDNPAV